MKRLFSLFVIVLSFTLCLQAQNITVKYVQEGTTVHAYVTTDDVSPKAWDHFLSPDEVTLLNTDPTTADAKISALAAQQFVVVAPVVVTPPAPVTLRSSTPIAAATAKSTVANYDTSYQQLQTSLTSLLAAVKVLPLATQLTLFSQVQAAVNAAIAQLPAPIVK